VTSYTTRPATLADAPAIARIYSEGIADRIATFETETRTSAQILEWFRPGTLIVVAEAEKDIAAFAASFPYSTRPCYAGIGEFSVYVARDQRLQGCRPRGPLGAHRSCSHVPAAQAHESGFPRECREPGTTQAAGLFRNRNSPTPWQARRHLARLRDS
jgi:hypothetical protein